MIERLLLILKVYTTSTLIKYDPMWDAKLKQLIEQAEWSLKKYTLEAKLGDSVFEVWCSNRFYYFGHLEERDGVVVPKQLHCRPSRPTMIQLELIRRRLESEGMTSARDTYYR
jgi:hypothetical protein